MQPSQLMLSLFSNPEQLSDHTALKMPCKSRDSLVIKPYAVFSDVPGIYLYLLHPIYTQYVLIMHT